MTDEERLILALECCGRSLLPMCHECPMSDGDGGCYSNLQFEALNVIKKQKAIIDFLKSENEEMRRDLEKENVRKTKSKLIKFFENKKINNKGE